MKFLTLMTLLRMGWVGMSLSSLIKQISFEQFFITFVSFLRFTVQWTKTSLVFNIFFASQNKLSTFEITWHSRSDRSITSKVHIFWEGHKILRNLHLTFVLCSQKKSGDFTKFCGLLRIYELYLSSCLDFKKKVICLQF